MKRISVKTGLTLPKIAPINATTRGFHDQGAGQAKSNFLHRYPIVGTDIAPIT